MLRKSRLGLIEGGRETPKSAAALPSSPLDAHLTKHLVLHLDQVRHRRTDRPETRRTNLLRVSVEGPTDLETFDFASRLVKSAASGSFDM